MKFFQDLGLMILDRWQRADLDGSAFPDIAQGALSERPPSANVDPMDVVRWVHDTPVLVGQADIDSKFGQPAITVFRCEAFYIDVLFWVDGTTAIHQHRFSGAFHVMQGSSIQSTYAFTLERKFSEHLQLGKLDLLDAELLTKGDVRPIRAGTDFVHALFHLDRPSASVVVRTPRDALAGPQFTYFRSGLAFDPFVKTESTTRKVQTLDLLHELNHPDFESIARVAIRNADSFLALRLLTHLMKRIRPAEKYLTFLDSVRPEHSDLVRALALHAEEDRREDKIISRRRLVRQPEHRLLLALLLSIPDRRRILELVARAFPGQPAIDTIGRWVVDMSRLDAMHAWVGNVAGVRVADENLSILDVLLDELNMTIVRHLLEGRSQDLLLASLRAPPALGGARVSDIDLLNRCIGVRKSLLRPLLIP